MTIEALKSDEGVFWDRRYRAEGAIWGDAPSPTARRAARYLSPGARVLEVGFGYGRDLSFLIRHGCQVVGIDLSQEGQQQAEARLKQEGLEPEDLLTGRFEDFPLPSGPFDAVVSHRVAHLLISREAIARFTDKVCQVLRPGGLLSLGARNRRDLDPAGMTRIEEGVYEYAHRPGHRIRYWDDESFQRAFGPAFTILALFDETELESVAQPVPCRLTVMVARKQNES